MGAFLDLFRRKTRSVTPIGSWTCSVCGESHDNLPAATFSAPLVWQDATEEERSRDFELNTDFCIWKEEHYFVRCVLELPMTDRDDVLSFGVWSSLSKDSFIRYMEIFDDADRGDSASMFGWFSNSLPGYPETLNLKCDVHPRDGGLRPIIWLQDTDHPLVEQQRQGLPFEQAVAFVHQHVLS